MGSVLLIFLLLAMLLVVMDGSPMSYPLAKSALLHYLYVLAFMFTGFSYQNPVLLAKYSGGNIFLHPKNSVPRCDG